MDHQQHQAPSSPGGGKNSTHQYHQRQMTVTTAATTPSASSPKSPTTPTSSTGGGSASRRTRLTEKMSRMHKRRGAGGGGSSINDASSPNGAGGGTASAASTPRRSSRSMGSTPTSAAGFGNRVNIATNTSNAADLNLLSQSSLSPSVGSSSGKAAMPRRFARKLNDRSSSRDIVGSSINNNNNNSSGSSSSLLMQSRSKSDSSIKNVEENTTSNTKPFSPPRPFGPMSSVSQPSSPKSTVSDGSVSGGGVETSNTDSNNNNNTTTRNSLARDNAGNNSNSAMATTTTVTAAAAAIALLSSLQETVPIKKTDSLTTPRVDAILTEVSSCASDVSSPGALANHRYHSSVSNHGTSLSEEVDDDDDESHDDDDDDDESQSQEQSDGESQDDDDEDADTHDDDEESHDDEEESYEEEEEDESCTNSPKTTTTAETPPRRIRNVNASASISPNKLSNSKSMASPHSQMSNHSSSHNNNNMDLIRSALSPPSLLNVSTASGASTACMNNLGQKQQQQPYNLNKNDSTLSTTNHPMDLSTSSGGVGSGALPPSNGSTPDRKGRNRVPGGAAAKLILLRPQNSDEEKDDNDEGKRRSGGKDDDLLRACAAGAFLGAGGRQAYNNDDDDDDDKERDMSEINVSMTRAKTEFAIGSAANRRYYKSHDDSEADTKSQRNYHGGCDESAASMAPSIFNRTEIFHQTAAAAVTALLTPRHLLASTYGGGGGTTGSLMGGGDAVSVMSLPPNLIDIQPNFSNFSMGQASVTSAFQTPKEPGQETLAYESLARRAVSPHLISETVESKLNKMADMMRDPNKTLAGLLTAINSPEDNPHGSSESSCGSQDDSRRGKIVGPGANNDESGEDSHENVEEKRRQDNMDIGYLVRRKNACGALQVLTASVENRVKIGWTVGVLPALTSVLRDTGDEGVTVTFPDKRRRREFEAARNRAVACLMNLSMPKKNRIPVFHTPNLVHWLVVIIMEGQGFPRKGCCAILAFLSKSVDNRKLMVHVPDLIEAATKVIKARPPRMESKSGAEEKADDFDTEEDDASKNGVSKKASAVSDQQSRLISVGSSFSNESDDTPRLGGAHSPVEISGYDETADELLRGSRQNIFAMLGHLVKEKDNAYHLVRHANLIAALSEITSFQSSPSHILAVQMLACLSRHRLNTKVMVFKHRMVVPALVKATQSVSDETRMYACFALQNLAQDKSCRQELAVSPGLVTCLCDRSREATATAERLAAISALKNLCDEPANLIPMTNTPDCIATLMHLAHGKEPGIDETMQYRACDALATLSHWLRKIATSGQCVENGKLTTPNASNTSSIRRELNIPKNTNVFVPSLRVVTWNQWE